MILAGRATNLIVELNSVEVKDCDGLILRNEVQQVSFTMDFKDTDPLGEFLKRQLILELTNLIKLKMLKDIISE